MKQGLLIIITGSIGAGKKTVRRVVAETNPRLTYLPVFTNRMPRRKEISGAEFRFLRQNEFQKAKEQGTFLFTFQDQGCEYGLDKEATEKALKEGKKVILERPHSAAKELRKMFPGRYTRTIDIHIPAERLSSRVKKNLRRAPLYQVKKVLSLAKQDNNDTEDFDVVLNNYELKRTAKRCNQSIEKRLEYIKAVEEGKDIPSDYVIKNS